MPFIGGIIDLAVDWAPTAGRDAFFAGNPIDQFPPEIVQLLPIVPRRAIINKYTMERFWEVTQLRARSSPLTQTARMSATFPDLP